MTALPGSAAPLFKGCLLVVGPDGAGKSAIADRLADLASQSGVAVARAHYRPGIVGVRRHDGGMVSEPHRQTARGPATAVAKLAVVFCDHLLGWLGPWRLQRRTGVLLLERGWYDMVIDPRRYRLTPRSSVIVRVLAVLLPKADVVLVLSGDAATIDARKPEIGRAEVERQMNAWRAIAPHAGRRVIELNTTAESLDATALRAWQALHVDRKSAGTSWRRVPLVPPRLDMRATGARTDALALYRPSRLRAKAVWPISQTLVRRGVARSADAPIGDVATLWRRLDIAADSVVTMRSSTVGRLLIGVTNHAQTRRLVVKLGGPDDERLHNEAAFLEALRNAPPPVRVPSVVWRGEWQGQFVLATEWEVAVDNARPPLSDVADLCTALVNGSGTIGSVTHGDMAPWNFVRSKHGLLLVDWEYARRERRPLIDLAHYVIQTGALLRAWSPAEALDLLCDERSIGIDHLGKVGADASDAPALVAEYLRSWPPRGRAIRYRHELWRALALRFEAKTTLVPGAKNG